MRTQFHITKRACLRSRILVLLHRTLCKSNGRQAPKATKREYVQVREGTTLTSSQTGVCMWTNAPTTCSLGQSCNTEGIRKTLQWGAGVKKRHCGVQAQKSVFVCPHQLHLICYFELWFLICSTRIDPFSACLVPYFRIANSHLTDKSKTESTSRKY